MTTATHNANAPTADLDVERWRHVMEHIEGHLVTRYTGPTSRLVVQDVRIFGVDIPTGYETDGASTPTTFYAIVPRFEDAFPAAIVHDLRYDPADGIRHLTRRQADDEFRRNLLHSGYTHARARLAWLAIRAGGWKAWNAGTRKGHRLA